MEGLSRFSYVFWGVLLIAAGVFAALQTPYTETFGLVTICLAALWVIFWVVARRGALTPSSPAKRIRRVRTSARPLVVHLYSDWSLLSLCQRVLAVSAERTYRGRCEFIYVDVGHREAEAAAQEADAGLGDFVLFDATGRRVAETRLLNRRTLDQLLEHPV